MPNPVEVVKRAAVEAVEAGKPVNILFGTVLSASPLKIQVDQKSIYTSKMLILTRNVTDFEVDMTVNHSTEDKGGGSGAAAYEAHKGNYSADVEEGTYQLLVKIGLAAKNNFNDVESLLNRVVPQNMVVTLLQLYNTHAELGRFTHAQLAAYTHNQLRNEVLKNGE